MKAVKAQTFNEGPGTSVGLAPGQQIARGPAPPLGATPSDQTPQKSCGGVWNAVPTCEFHFVHLTPPDVFHVASLHKEVTARFHWQAVVFSGFYETQLNGRNLHLCFQRLGACRIGRHPVCRIFFFFFSSILRICFCLSAVPPFHKIDVAAAQFNHGSDARENVFVAFTRENKNGRNC